MQEVIGIVTADHEPARASKVVARAIQQQMCAVADGCDGGTLERRKHGCGGTRSEGPICAECLIAFLLSLPHHGLSTTSNRAGAAAGPGRWSATRVGSAVDVLAVVAIHKTGKCPHFRSLGRIR